jgi:hypothetical protein
MSATSHFVYIWTYEANPDREAEFLSAYRSDGEWARFFSRDENYIRTELLQDADRKLHYITIDYWTSKLARDSFRGENAEEFHELDEKCEAYTVSESFVGDFVAQTPESPQ